MVDQQERFSELFTLKEQLGKGAFSVVKKVVNVKTGEVFAAKIINTRRLTTRDLQKLEREARICRTVKHPSIVRMHHVYQEDYVRYMTFDLVTGGELFDDIVAREYYTEKDASLCIRQILESVAHCHSKRIIHRDIKPENLLLASKSKGASVKLADFGLALEAMNGKHYYGFAGTPGYLSPEVIRKEPYSFPTDIWACGIILYILLVGYPPFWDDDRTRMFELIKRGKYEYPSPEWDSVTQAAKDLIDKMLITEQNERISAANALKHPWISRADDVASVIHRQETISVLKRFNARRKLKAAVHTALLISKKSSIFMAARNKTGCAEEIVREEPEEPELGQTPEESDIIKMTQRLINSIADKRYEEYVKLCIEDMTCFEPESCSQLVSGMEFHKFYFDHFPVAPNALQQSILTPKVHMLGETGAVIAYIRLIQFVTKEGVASSVTIPETRVWQKFDNDWKCVHSHRSSGASTSSNSPPKTDFD